VAAHVRHLQPARAALAAHAAAAAQPAPAAAKGQARQEPTDQLAAAAAAPAAAAAAPCAVAQAPTATATATDQAARVARQDRARAAAAAAHTKLWLPLRECRACAQPAAADSQLAKPVAHRPTPIPITAPCPAGVSASRIQASRALAAVPQCQCNRRNIDPTPYRLAYDNSTVLPILADGRQRVRHW
jgi:hypothetical protein